jgi:hypothetical protein
MPCNASYARFILESFSYAQQIDMQPICTPMLVKFYSCKRWVLQVIFRPRPSVSSWAEANIVVFSASALDTLSSASLSTRVARSSASLTRMAVLSHTATASRAEASVVSIAAAWAASTTTATSCA